MSHVVTDHAILRWLERVEGIDICATRRRIQQAAAKAPTEGAVAVKIEGGARLEIRNGFVVTVKGKRVHQRPSQRILKRWGKRGGNGGHGTS